LDKIYFIRSNANKIGGAEKYLSRLRNQLKKNNIESEIITRNFSRCIPSWLAVIYFNFLVCLTKREKFYFSLERINCPDIYRAGDGVHKYFLRKIKKSKLNPLHRLYLYLEKRCFKNSKKIIANSEFVKKQIVNEYHIDSDKIVTIYNGINHKDFDSQISKKKIRKVFDVKEKPVILFVGSGFHRKGLANFLEILSLIDGDFISFIIGKDKNLEHYKNKAHELKIVDKVYFLGEIKEVSHYYAAADFLILPTHYEPFSNVILEAMSFKTVVFTTKQNGASEILDREFVMDDPYDISVATKISNIISNPDALEKHKNNHFNISKKYTIEKNFEQTLRLLNEIID